MLPHVQIGWEELVLLGVDHGEGVDRNQDLVSLAVNSNRVVEVLLLIVGGELDVDVLSDARGHHAFLVVLDFEVGRLRRQDVQPLRRGRVVDQAHSHGVGLESFKARKLDDARARPENAIRAHVVVDVYNCQLPRYLLFFKRWFTLSVLVLARRRRCISSVEPPS